MGAWSSHHRNAEGPVAEFPAPPKPRGLFRRLPRTLRVLILAPIVACLVGAILLSAAMIQYTIRFPDPMALRKREAAPIVRVLARDGTVLTERGQAYDFVPLDLLPKHLIDAVVATEDRRFFDHWGLDPIGLVRAAFANLRAGRYAQGGSTLTQQLAKNLFLSSERTLDRKIDEFVLALWLEVRLSKRDILELYLNRVYFGGGAYGIEAASRRYFDKSARSLTLAESAVIAGLLKAPSKYSPLSSPGTARSRARVVLKSMLAAGLISGLEETAAAAASVRFTDPSAGREPTGLEYAVEFVLERLPPLAGSGHKEIIVETTFDASLQKRSQIAIEDILAKDGTEAAAQQAAVIVVDTDGGIRALVGGRSWAQSQFNRAIKARRQPGSAFKPLVYLAAVEQGAGPDSMVLDMPVNINGWSPRNESGHHRGAMTMRQGLAHSVNTVAVRLQQDVGTSRVQAVARRLGIKSALRTDPSLALGTSEVSLIEMTGAYAVLASGGLAVEPHAIRQVRTSSGTVLYARPAQRAQMIVAPDHIGAMNSMLNTALVSGTGRRAALPRHPAAGKTGTTQDFRDAWFVGYTSHLAAGVWFGNDGGEPMSRVMGGGLPAQLWRTVMMQAHERLPPAPLPGMERQQMAPAMLPPPADTLRDTDLVAAPMVAPRQPAIRSQPPATTLAIPPARPTPRLAHARPVPRIAKPAAPTATRMPSQPIDADLFVRALSPPQAAPPSRAFAAPAMDIDHLKRLIGSEQRRMGLGVKPDETKP